MIIRRSRQNDVESLFQRSKQISIRIDLRNEDVQLLASLEGDVLDLNFSCDSLSDIRRTCDMTLHVRDHSYLVASDSKIWFDKSLKVWLCVLDQRTQELRTHLLGTFLMLEQGYRFDAASSTLSLSCVDYMAKLTEARGSQIGASQTVVPVDSGIRSAMLAVLRRAKIRNYNVCEFPYDIQTVPYDLEFDAGCYPHDILVKLRDLYPCYEIYFDHNGMFQCEKTPSRIDDPITLSAEIFDPLILSENRDSSFGAVKNVTEVWGQSLESDYFAASCVLVGTNYKLRFDFPNEALENNATFGFTCDRDNPENPTLQVDALAANPIFLQRDKSDGTRVEEPIPAATLRAGIPYVIKYVSGRFYLQGELEIHAIVKEVAAMPTLEAQERDRIDNDCRNIAYVVNPDSPFCVEKIGEIRRVCTGGDFDNIYTTELALARASYENWTTTRLADEVTIRCVAIPWLEVNSKVEYTSPLTGEKAQYLVKSFSLSIPDFTMDVRLSKFYPYYPFTT